MSKTATRTPESQTESTVTEFPGFDAAKASDQFRAFAEKSVEQSKDAYERVKTGVEEAQKAIEATYDSAKSAANELSLKSVAAMRSNAEVNFAHLESLIGAKTFSEVIELQTTFLRKRIELAVEQIKDLQGITSKITDDVSKPAKDAFEKAMKNVKVA